MAEHRSRITQGLAIEYAAEGMVGGLESEAFWRRLLNFLILVLGPTSVRTPNGPDSELLAIR